MISAVHLARRSARAARTVCRIAAAQVVLVATLAVPVANAQTTQLQCPTDSINLQSGIYYINQACEFDGDIVLGGTAMLAVLNNLTVDGDILLSGNARLVVKGATLTIDNQNVFDHRIESRGNAQIHFVDSTLKTNASRPGHSLPTQFTGYDQSIMWVQNSKILQPDSWLLADLNDSAVVRLIESDFPSEIYPHESSTVVLEGSASRSRVWLEFLNGEQSVIDGLPNETVSFNWSFGRNTPGVTNVGYQVEIINAQPSIGVSSHPGSQVTLRDTQTELAIGYFLTDITAPQQISNIGPGSRDIVLNHQARRLELDNANIFEFGWQIYSANPTVAQVQPVAVYNSMINEIGTLQRGRISLDACVLQWALIAALGPGSRIELSRSTINSQSIVAATDAAIHIDASEIFGSVVEASDDASILFTNVEFKSNICHARCLPGCASVVIGGANRCNPFNPAGASSAFKAEHRARIAALGLRPIAASITVGNTLDLIGDLFVVAGPEAAHLYTYTLRYRQIGGSGGGIIVANAQGSKRDQSLGVLNTTALAPGNYAAILELHSDGLLVSSVARPFTLVSQ